MPLDLPSPARSTLPSSFGKGPTRSLPIPPLVRLTSALRRYKWQWSAAAIANGGVVKTPHVLKEIRDIHGDVVKKGDDGDWTRATSGDTAKSMTANMIRVVQAGTGRARKHSAEVKVAGKTGTAQTGIKRKTGEDIHAWFTSFAPADDPQIAVAVVVENVEGRSEATGGAVAAPIAKKVIQAALGIS